MRPAIDVSDEIVSAANIVTCGGYYECDPDSVAAIIEADRIEQHNATVREIVEWLRDQETKGFDRMRNAATATSERNYAAGAVAIQKATDEIERRFLK